MKFLSYTLGDPDAPFDEPSPEMYEKMGAFIEEATKAGIILATGGIAPLNEALKISYVDGQYTVRDGPFSEAKELVGGWALMECRDKDEAIEWTKRFLAVAGHGDVTVREVFGP
jgi:hypothetical protein